MPLTNEPMSLSTCTEKELRRRLADGKSPESFRVQPHENGGWYLIMMDDDEIGVGALLVDADEHECDKPFYERTQGNEALRIFRSVDDIIGLMYVLGICEGYIRLASPPSNVLPFDLASKK